MLSVSIISSVSYLFSNLLRAGDIRSLLTPKKPQRPSAFSASSRGDSEIGPKKSEDIYETLPATVEEEEDHYTYLDEAEVTIAYVSHIKFKSFQYASSFPREKTECMQNIFKKIFLMYSIDFYNKWEAGHSIQLPRGSNS